MGLTLEPHSHWKTWPFGQSLIVEGSSPIPVDDFSPEPDEVTAEGLQTLLFLNLEKLFPDWGLRRHPVAVDPRGPVVFEATDPVGVRHLFALHDVQTSEYASSRLLAAVLDRFGAELPGWFDEIGDDRIVDEIGARILGFWSGLEAMSDPESTAADRAADEVAKARLEALAERPEVAITADEARRDARTFVDKVSGESKGTPDEATGVHLHLVVADAEEIDSGELEVMMRLRDQGLRVDFWEIQLDNDRDRRRGTLGIRPVHFPDFKPKAFSSIEDRRATELLAAMARLNPELHQWVAAWSYTPDHEQTILRTEFSVDEPCRGPFFSITARDDELEFKASIKIPEHIGEAHSLTDLRTQVTPVSMEAIRAWIALALPPDPAEYAEAARRLEHSLHHSKRWGGYLRTSDTGPVVPARGWHSGGFRSATIAVDTTDPTPAFDDLATLGNKLLKAFVDTFDTERQNAGSEGRRQKTEDR